MDLRHCQNNNHNIPFNNKKHKIVKIVQKIMEEY